MLSTVSSLFTRSYAWLHMVTQFTRRYITVCFTLIYWVSYVSLCSFTGIVTHGYGYLPGWLRMVTQIYTHGYAWLRFVTGMVTHGYADVR